MKPMSQKEIDKWAKTREMGRQRFTWIYGVLMWGIPTGIAWAILMAAIQGWNRLPILLPIALIGFPIGGVFFGKLIWKMSEARYQEALRTRTKDD